MTRRRQIGVLGVLFGLGFALLAFLHGRPATIDGQLLLDAASTVPLSRLRTGEREHMYVWLAVDCVFALVYTVFYTAALRMLAANTASRVMSFAGRSLSWLTAVAIVFDLTENAILWAGAGTSAPQVSPSLVSLASLKFVSTWVFLAYVAAWFVVRWRARPRPGSAR